MPKKKIIAIQNDRYNSGHHGIQSFSEQWADTLSESRLYEPKIVNIFSNGNLGPLAGANAFMMRPMGNNKNYDLARKIIPAIENGMGIPTFPNGLLAWLSRDKLAQSFWLESSGFPTAITWSFLDLKNANEFLRKASYPLVAKTADGCQSDEVVLLNDTNEALAFSNELFRFGVNQIYQATSKPYRRFPQRVRQAWRFIRGLQSPRNRKGGYVYFQEFIPGNQFDVRVIIIGRFALAFRRHNRPGDFRASASDSFDRDGHHVDADSISLAFNVADKIGCPFIAADILFKDGRPIICEINLGYSAWKFEKIRGYWERDKQNNKSQHSLCYRDGYLDPYKTTLYEWVRYHNMQPIDPESD